MAERFFVDVVDVNTNKPAHTLGPYPSERGAERAERGLHINLDHARFYTSVRSEKSARSKKS